MKQLPVQDSLVDLERYRLRLEDNLVKLRRALQHWQTWEAEYEGLKEEIQAIPSDATQNDLIEVGKSFGGDLVTEKEIRDLLGIDKGLERSGKQVVELVSRRIDYVQRNVESMQKQVDGAQLKLESVEVVSMPDAHNKEGLPITEIYEELDDDGNVISSRTSHPDDVKPHILEALKKVGLKENDLDTGASAVEDAKTATPEATSEHEGHESTTVQTPEDDSLQTRKKSVSFAEGTKQNTSDTTLDLAPSHSDQVPLVVTEGDLKPRKKSVSFADGTKQNVTDSVMHHSLPYAVGKSPPTSCASGLAEASFANKDRFIVLDEDDKPIAVSMQKAPIDESPEDSALRRQMQAYSMREVGDIVAQLDLEENGSQTSYDDEDSDSDQHALGLTASSEDDDDENQYGMDVDDHMSEEYKNEMLALEKKLNARMLQNVGPNPDLPGEYDLAADTRRLVVQREKPMNESEATATNDTKQKDKSVRFSETLDIAPNPDSRPEPKVRPQGDASVSNSAVKDTITERNSSNVSREAKSRPASRFKKAQQAAEPAEPSEETIPHRSADNPLAANIIERSHKSPRPPPDEFHPDIVNQEINTEYYRQRNRIIQKQGGFTRHMNEEEEVELDKVEDEVSTAPRKKVSLFKAARAYAGESGGSARYSSDY